MSSNTLRTGIGATEKPRKARGGAGPYRKGAEAERRAKKAYEAAGWHVTRSPQSGSAVDLLCVSKTRFTISQDMATYSASMIEWVQQKSSGYLRPAEKAAVIALADEFGGVPVLGWIVLNVLHRKNLLTGEFLEDLPCLR
jgi:Holliday junction resolvase